LKKTTLLSNFVEKVADTGRRAERPENPELETSHQPTVVVVEREVHLPRPVVRKIEAARGVAGGDLV